MIKFNVDYLSNWDNSDKLNELFKSKEFDFLTNSDKNYIQGYIWSIDESKENYLCLKYPELLTKITKEN